MASILTDFHILIYSIVNKIICHYVMPSQQHLFNLWIPQIKCSPQTSFELSMECHWQVQYPNNDFMITFWVSQWNYSSIKSDICLPMSDILDPTHHLSYKLFRNFSKSNKQVCLFEATIGFNSSHTSPGLQGLWQRRKVNKVHKNTYRWEKDLSCLSFGKIMIKEKKSMSNLTVWLQLGWSQESLVIPALRRLNEALSGLLIGKATREQFSNAR